MKLFFPCLLVVGMQHVAAQKQGQKQSHAKSYLSVSPALVTPLGVFTDGYKSGYSLQGIMHFKWLNKGAELQLVAGYERFTAKNFNYFGAVSTIPMKVGVLQMVTQKYYLYGRLGLLGVKDQRSSFAMRFSSDLGMGYAFKNIALDVGLHAFVRKGANRLTNYMSFGMVLPFRRSSN